MAFSFNQNPGGSDSLAELRAECELAESEAAKAVLLHEIGVLADDAHNDGQAARDLLSAVNALPGFNEPLERLVVLIERRKSYKNLGKLVDRLTKVAETPEERSRAFVALSEFKEDQEADEAAARDALERATEAKPDDTDAWLYLERLAARAGDAEARERALSTRAELAVDPTWKALLLLDVGRTRAARGDVDGAIVALERAADSKTDAAFEALSELARVATASGRGEIAARALESKAALIQAAIVGATEDGAAAVPAALRTESHVADAWIGASTARRSLGQTDQALELLDRVVSLLPDDPVALFARLRAAESTGDTDTAATLARAEIARGTKGPAAAALWMRIAEASAASGDAKAALDALASALAEDPACIPARSLQLHLLGGGDPALLAGALEGAANQLGSESLAARFFLLAAETWSRGASDSNAARAALSQAAASSASLELVARTGRMLAAIAGDAAWFDESTKRLLATNPAEAERPSLWFELGRSRLLRGEAASADEAFVSLASAPGGAFLGSALRAYAALGRPDAEKVRDPTALEALSDLSTETDLSRAFRTAAALRFRLAGKKDEALADLRELHESEPGDVLAATALSVVLAGAGDATGAATVLEICAAACVDAEVAAALRLEAGIVLFRAGERERAIACFEAGAGTAPEAGSALLSWALRAAKPSDVSSRRKALDAAESSEDRGALAVERFGLEAGSDGERAAAATSLADVSGEDVQARALALARSLWALDGTAKRAAALDALSEKSPEAAAIARTSAHFASLSESETAEARAETARAFAAAEKTLAAALEWVAQSAAHGDADAEIAAREELAARLGGRTGTAVLSTARLAARLAKGDTDTPLLPRTGPEADLVNLELSPPSCDPHRRATALLAARDVLDESSRAAASALAGWNLLAAGDSTAAITAFRAYVDEHGEDIVGWEGLRAAAEHAGDKPLLAQASAALGDLVSDPHQGAELWERAATILLDDLGDAQNGELALSRAITRDIGRTGAFDRLFRMVRARKDGPRLLELAEQRLAVAEDPQEIAKLYWERARVLRESGDADGALEALENVTMLEPDHVGALALTGEIYITDKRFEEAAEKLARLASLSAAPAQQRLMSGIAAVDLYENRLGRVDRALEVLSGLHRSGLSTLPVRERLARAAAKAESWERATEVLEELMGQRDTREGRIEAARLAMVLYRDRLSSPGRAEKAVERLLAEAPDDGEALDLVLRDVFPKGVTQKLLSSGRDAVIESLSRSPLDVEGMARLAEIAKKTGDLPLRQVTLGALVALGKSDPSILGELATLDGRVARTPQIAVDDRVVDELRDPEDQGATADLMRWLATTLAEALGPGLTALGVGKKERVRPQDGLPVRNEVAAWVGALGLGEFELYVGGRDPNSIYAVGTEVPSIVVGGSVQSPLSAAHRQALARELLGLKLGTTILRHREPADVSAIIVAACNVVGVKLDSPPYAMLAEFERLIGKEMPRKVRKALPEIAQAIQSSGQDPLEWVRAAQSSLDRMAAVAIGDVSFILSPDERSRGQAQVTSEGKLRAERLIAFVLSPSFFTVREQLGMGVR
ncbi:MAG TPA: tetratricopeptide repeat protein [Polyangiaceae bacterium]|nr:tetratricopeptide repeat protein [Polyangiaceae bacterium]